MAGQRFAIGHGRQWFVGGRPGSLSHLLMAGTSGSGKTRFGLRPLITSALASGWQVAIYDRSGLDFLPFQQHPNAHAVLLEIRLTLLIILHCYAEVIQRRFVTLREAGVSTWGQATTSTCPRILAVMDEFANFGRCPPLPMNGGSCGVRSHDCRRRPQSRRPSGTGLAGPHPQEPGLTHPAQLPASFFSRQGRRCQPCHSGHRRRRQLPPRQFLTVMDQLLRGVCPQR